ncbi:hypothetical protein DERP_006859 [Dermatophagoides pteronyssinus]|uniref:Uncharacterized protein n=1 Tax=Dermatophagoides pteronyssinus TaxID=6956 RepID=A0ABQ8ISC0_DERPT|nr:hypothetical protein DERP_006859 [Dermatophagoides pteronyssinus]
MFHRINGSIKIVRKQNLQVTNKLILCEAAGGIPFVATHLYGPFQIKLNCFENNNKKAIGNNQLIFDLIIII